MSTHSPHYDVLHHPPQLLVHHGLVHPLQIDPLPVAVHRPQERVTHPAKCCTVSMEKRDSSLSSFCIGQRIYFLSEGYSLYLGTCSDLSSVFLLEGSQSHQVCTARCDSSMCRVVHRGTCQRGRIVRVVHTGPRQRGWIVRVVHTGTCQRGG